jgi:hypothetical protein
MNNSDDNTENNFDVMGMISQFMPDLDMTCNTNMVLMNKIYKDIIYIFSTDMDGIILLEDRIKDKIAIYRELITNEKLTVNEMMSCLWKISTNETMKNYITEMNKADITIEMMITLGTEFVPQEMIDQVGGIDVIKGMLSGSEGGDITSMMSMFGKMNCDTKPEDEEIPLTEAQMKELEDYYDNMS